MKNKLHEKAIARYLEALRADTLPDDLKVNIYSKLALAYSKREKGAVSDNINQAIEYFKLALQYDLEAEEQAQINHNLSIAYLKKESGDPSENIEQSIHYCRQALNWRKADSTPIQWADSQISLGDAYVMRITGDKQENIEHAISCYENALTIVTIQADPDQWGNINICLAAAYLAHPKRRRKHDLQCAIHCREAQRVYSREKDPVKWQICEDKIKSQRSVDPAVKSIESLVAQLKDHAIEDDPFGGIADKLLNYVQDPRNRPKSEKIEARMKDLIELSANKIRKTVAEKLNKPELVKKGYLNIHVVADWDINAQIAINPPYNIYISTSLVRFCASMSELLMYGLGLTIIDDDGSKIGQNVDPKLSTDEISECLKKMLDAFMSKKEMPDIPRASGPAHLMISLVTFFTTMAFLVSHEIGHVITTEHKTRGETPPFGDYVKSMLDIFFENIIAGHHHPLEPEGLKDYDKKDLPEIFSNWKDEINSDIIGASLALEFQSKEGPWREVPDISAQTKLGIHMAFVSQMILNLYCNLADKNHLLISPSHPPMDFRKFCVLKWMYDDKIEEAEQPITEYTQEIIEKLLDIKVK